MSESPKLTTFDIHNQHVTVPYSDPALLPRRKTTHDAAVERLTQEYQPVQVGAPQVQGGATYRFDSENLKVLSD